MSGPACVHETVSVIRFRMVPIFGMGAESVHESWRCDACGAFLNDSERPAADGVQADLFDEDGG